MQSWPLSSLMWLSSDQFQLSRTLIDGSRTGWGRVTLTLDLVFTIQPIHMATNTPREKNTTNEMTMVIPIVV